MKGWIKFYLGCQFKWFGVLTTQHSQTLQHFDQFYMFDLNIKGNKFWKAMWMIRIKSIWEHRNSIKFRNRRRNDEEIFEIARLKAWTWLRNKISKTIISYSNWCLCLKTWIQSILKYFKSGIKIRVSSPMRCVVKAFWYNYCKRRWLCFVLL